MVRQIIANNMKRVIFLILFLSTFCLFQSCQTFIPDNYKNESGKIISPIDDAILGVWENSTFNSEGPPSICAVMFEKNNEFNFYPVLGSGNKTYRKGNYIIIGDTLLIHFMAKNISEKYLFDIVKNELNLKPVKNQYSYNSLTGTVKKLIYTKKQILDPNYFGPFMEE